MTTDDWAEFEAMEGTTEGVECSTCHGKGLLPDSADWCGIEPGGTVRCPTCRGTGRVAVAASTAYTAGSVPGSSAT